MQDETNDESELHRLAEQFNLHDAYDPSEIPDGIVAAMEYIRDNTGLLGDYHDGLVFLGEGGTIIQWYGRGSLLSDHDNLFHWVQMERDDIMVGLAGKRIHPETHEVSAYAEIHPTSKWGYDDE